MDAYGQDIQGLFGDQLAAGRINRQLYAIPGDAYCARAGGVMVNMELAQAARLTIPETCTLDDLESMFAALKAYSPEHYGIAFETGDMSIINYFFEIENYGSGIFAFGVTFQPVKAPSWKICLPRKPIATSAIERANGSRAAIFRRIV